MERKNAAAESASDNPNADHAFSSPSSSIPCRARSRIHQNMKYARLVADGGSQQRLMTPAI